jgi:hypothetical protein
MFLDFNPTAIKRVLLLLDLTEQDGALPPTDTVVPCVEKIEATVPSSESHAQRGGEMGARKEPAPVGARLKCASPGPRLDAKLPARCARRRPCIIVSLQSLLESLDIYYQRSKCLQ